VEILILLIPLSVVIALGIGIAFWWSAEDGQFDDLESPGQRILMDDDRAVEEQEKNKPQH
jgi:cbb3-type cytochrome oxidase maturation protein